MVAMSVHDETPDLNEVQTFLSKWRLTASADGALWIQPRSETLELQDFSGLLRRVQRVCADQSYAFVVFYFDGVRVDRETWSLILRAAEDAAASVHADCRVFRLYQPAQPENANDGIRRTPSNLRSHDCGTARMLNLDGTSIVIHPSTDRVSVP